MICNNPSVIFLTNILTILMYFFLLFTDDFTFYLSVFCYFGSFKGCVYGFVFDKNKNASM